MYEELKEPKQMTNADRIRSMTDEELAEWIWWNDMPYFTGKFEVVEWLKEEVNDGIS